MRYIETLLGLFFVKLFDFSRLNYSLSLVKPSRVLLYPLCYISVLYFFCYAHPCYSTQLQTVCVKGCYLTLIRAALFCFHLFCIIPVCLTLTYSVRHFIKSVLHTHLCYSYTSSCYTILCSFLLHFLVAIISCICHNTPVTLFVLLTTFTLLYACHTLLLCVISLCYRVVCCNLLAYVFLLSFLSLLYPPLHLQYFKITPGHMDKKQYTHSDHDRSRRRDNA